MTRAHLYFSTEIVTSVVFVNAVSFLRLVYQCFHINVGLEYPLSFLAKIILATVPLDISTLDLSLIILNRESSDST